MDKKEITYWRDKWKDANNQVLVLEKRLVAALSANGTQAKWNRRLAKRNMDLTKQSQKLVHSINTMAADIVKLKQKKPTYQSR